MIRPLSDEEKAENWRACRRYIRRLLILPVLVAIAFVWLAGYGQGLMEGATICARKLSERN